jgi:phosphoenolpyruvate synthase/pyruvate phosphate dikinase
VAATEHICWFSGCQDAGADRVGGKALGLGRLTALGLPVPPGFAVTTAAYREHVATGGLLDRVAAVVGAAADTEARAKASEEVERLFAEAPMPSALEAELRGAYRELGEDVPVAVRSSADAEDTADASFAGQQESFLWVRGEDSVVDHVRRCWASLFTPQAIAYRADRGIRTEDVAMGVVVQEMVPASVAGVMMTLDPVTGDRSQVTIEAAYGLGLGLVSGEVTPDRYTVDKVALSVRDREARDKHVAFVFDAEAGEVRTVEVDEADRQKLCLAESEVVAIATIGKQLERDLGAPQDVEWALGPGEPGSREVHLLQTRPETVWSKTARPAVARKGMTAMERMLETMRTPVRLKD